MRTPFPFSILLGAALLSFYFALFVDLQGSNRVALYWVSPTSLYDKSDLVQSHETDSRIADAEYIASLKSLFLQERQLTMQVKKIS